MSRESELGVFTIVCVALLLFSRCTKPYRDQVREREFTAMESYFKSQNLTFWKYEDLRYAEIESGDSLNTQNGDVLELYYALFYLSGSNLTLVATNDTASARVYKLPKEAYNDAPLRVEIGKTALIKGLEIGLREYAHLNGCAWLGIPSELAYGEKRFGKVPSNTPILCWIKVTSATSAKVPS